MDLKRITYFLIVSFVASFLIRTIGTLFPLVFQNVWIVELAIATNTIFIFVHLLFYIFFMKSYALDREKTLKAGSFLAIIGTFLVAFIYLKNFCLVFDLDLIPLSLKNHYFDAIIPLAGSLLQLLFFSIFKKVQSPEEYRALNRPLSSAIIGVGIFAASHVVVLMNFLMSGKFNWIEHMPRPVAIGTLPLIVAAAIFIFYFYLKFYQYLTKYSKETISDVTASDTGIC